MVLIWNVLIYNIFYALIYILWYIYEALYLALLAIWEGLTWVYLNILIPFLIWFSNTAVPYIVEFIIIPFVAFTLTLIIWIMTLGNVDFWNLYDVIHTQLLLMSNVFIEIVVEITENIVSVVIFIGLYLLFTLLCFLKHIVVKARGIVNRSLALQESFDAYMFPIKKFYELCLAIKQLIANWF